MEQLERMNLKRRLCTTYVGPFAVALLLAYGLERFIWGIERPLEGGLVNIGSLILHGRLGTVSPPLGHGWFLFWAETFLNGTLGVLLLVVGVWLGFWLFSNEKKEPI